MAAPRFLGTHPAWVPRHRTTHICVFIAMQSGVVVEQYEERIDRLSGSSTPNDKVGNVRCGLASLDAVAG